MRKITLKRILVIAMTIAMLGTMTTAVSAEESAGETAEALDLNGDGVFRVGYAVSSLSESFAITVMHFVEEVFGEAHPDWELIVQDSNYSTDTELAITESFIQQDCDVILYHPVDTKGSVGSIEACASAGIPAITLINVVECEPEENIWIGAQNYDCGKIIAEFMKDKLPENAKVCILQGPAGTVNSQDRVDGFFENIGRDDLEILDEQYGDWMMEKGLSITESWIQAYPEIDYLFSCSDTMTPGAVEALKAANRLEDTLVTSVDCSYDGLTCLANGDYECDMLYNGRTAAELALEACERLLAGEDFTKIDDMTYPFELITPDKAQETIDWYFAE